MRAAGLQPANPEGFGPEEDRPGKKTGIGGRIGMVLFGLPFLLLGGLFMFFGGIRPLTAALAAKTWDEVPCRIIRSEVVEADKTAKIAVAYSYARNGVNYTATEPDIARRGMSGSKSDERTRAREFVARHPANHDDRCRVNPKNPAEATLETTIPGMIWFIIPFTSIFVLVGAGISGAGLGFFKKRAKGVFKQPAAASFKDPNSKKSRAAGILFGLIFFSAGAAVCVFLGMRPALKSHAAASWTKVPCHIRSSSVGSHSDSDGTTDSVDIEYDYAYQGKQYIGDAYDFTGGASSGYEDKAAVVRRYPAGGTGECLVNPAKPDEAVITRELTWVTWFFGFGFSGIFMAVGGFVAYAGATGRLGAQGFRTKLTRTPEGRIVLKPSSTPGAVLAFLIFFALIWNGITSVFVVQVVKSFGPGRSPDWFQALFMIPFVVIGLGTIIGVFFSFAKLFAPRVLLETEKLPAPGEKFTLRWRVSGDSSRLASLKIFLEGREEAMEQRRSKNDSGTQHTRAFRRVQIADIAGPLRESGVTTFTLPLDLPPSLTLGHNAIKWRLLVRGVVNGHMNIASDHPVEINPAINPFA